MWPELSDEALELDGAAVTFAELLLVGETTGLLEEAVTATRRGWRALRLEGIDTAPEALHKAAVGFRRERNLESGEDLRSWLAEHGVTIDQWEAHLRRMLAGARLGHPGDSGDSAGREPDRDLVAIDMACGGWWQRFADAATRLWAAERLVPSAPGTAGGDPTGRPGPATAVFPALAAFGEHWCAGRLSVIRGRQLALAELTRRCEEPGAVAARIEEHAGEWTELSFDELRLPTREAASEAVLCANEDGIPAAALAERAASALRTRASRQGALPRAVAAALEAATPGRALGPLQLDGEWGVLWLRRRRPPSADEADTRATAAAELLSEALAGATRGLVRRTGPL